MKKLFIILIVSLCFGFTSEAQTQKFGHLNSLQLIADLPEIQTANTTLEVFQIQLEAQGKVMVKKLEADYGAYMIDINSGNLSKLQIAKAESDIQLQQQTIQQYDTEAQNKISAKRGELYQPILDKVKKIMDEIGKEQGYTMIFDTSQGSLLHAAESEDLTEVLRTRLGL